jgi:hypothetical protein
MSCDLPNSLPPTSHHFPPRSGLFTPSRRRVGKTDREKMETPLSHDKFNARRQAVVVKGLPLLALAFQTLGMFAMIPAPHSHVV